MFKHVYKVNKIKKTFNAIPSGFDKPKAKKFKLRQMDFPPGADNIVAHHQGMEVLDGNSNFLISGSTIGNPSYCHVVKNGKGYKLANGKKYMLVDIAYTHPGGIQAAEDILAVGNEQYNGATTYGDRSTIKFYDISNDRKVESLDHLKIVRDVTTGYDNEPIASAVGITRHNDQWIVAVRAKKTVDFYTLNGDIRDETNSFKRIARIDKESNHLHDYQGIYLYFSDEDKMYLFGMPMKTENDDKCFLHLIKTKKKNNKIIGIHGAKTIRIRHFKRNGRGPRFKYASCIEFIPGDSDNSTKGKFRIYSVEANVNDGEIRGNYWSL